MCTRAQFITKDSPGMTAVNMSATVWRNPPASTSVHPSKDYLHKGLVFSNEDYYSNNTCGYTFFVD